MPEIIVTGRGPQFKDSRITVYDVLAETQAGATPEELATWYGLTVEHIQVALRYIDDHRAEVEEGWRHIKERHARGNPPDLQARLEASHAHWGPLLAELKRRHQEPSGNGHEGTTG
jgi:uncharacterized protein (DUF433 family)